MGCTDIFAALAHHLGAYMHYIVNTECRPPLNVVSQDSGSTSTRRHTTRDILPFRFTVHVLATHYLISEKF
ncbi:hypothetical protein PM082_021852 [Marasmius tenuissimus]|nr:hypothetical protein PM082_021852 [Marasmius tenuissimus]